MRNDFIDGANLTGKFIAKAHALRDYIISYNEKTNTENQNNPNANEKKLPIREALLSGGDPLTLSNRRLFEYFDAIGDAGVEVLRIGTRELAFMPERIDEAFTKTLEIVHERHPDMRVNFVVHFSHPDEFLIRDSNGDYIKNDSGTGLKWMAESARAVNALRSLKFVTLQNQTPMITGVNDDPDALHLLHQELNRMGIKPKYVFQNRTILGYRAFSLPLEEAWWIHKKAMEGLSDDARSRMAMSTKRGKLEIVNSNPNALWLDDYTNENVLHDTKVSQTPKMTFPQIKGDLVNTKETLKETLVARKVRDDSQNEVNLPEKKGMLNVSVR